MEKTGQRKTYRDPALNKIIQEKAAWNKQVSALINDLIHFKKSMNGWPSKYYKERTRITQPLPVDLSGILNQITGDFQEISSRGNSILQEQAEFSKAHIGRKREQALGRLEKMRGPAETAPAPTAPPAGAAPDLAQQLGKGLASSNRESELVKFASYLEDKYFLEAQASNPFSRFITKLFTPTIGFGEGARIRRLRMTLLDNCVKAYKALKVLHKEIVKSSKSSIVNSHKMMTLVWNHWNIVNRLFSAYKAQRPHEALEQGGIIARPESIREKGRGEKPASEPAGEAPTPQTRFDATALSTAEQYSKKVVDYRNSSPYISTSSPAFKELNSVVESIMAVPQDYKINALLKSNIPGLYNQALIEVNLELGTRGNSFSQIVQELNDREEGGQSKTAQRQLRKLRHQIIPGATSSSRLEIYNKIDQIKRDLDNVMNLLEKGLDVDQLTVAIGQVQREMTEMRTLMRSLYYSEKPEEASTPFF